MYHLLKAAVPVRLNIIFACCVDIQIKAEHYFDCSSVGSHPAKDILILKNLEIHKKHSFFVKMNRMILKSRSHQ